MKEIMQGTMPGERRRGRPRTAWMDNIKTWIGLSVEESVRMTEDRDKWRKYVHGVCGQPSDRTRTAEEQIRSECNVVRRCVRRYDCHVNRVHPCAAELSACCRYVAAASEDKSVRTAPLLLFYRLLYALNHCQYSMLSV